MTTCGAREVSSDCRWFNSLTKTSQRVIIEVNCTWGNAAQTTDEESYCRLFLHIVWKP
ncbi:hypothetical protein GQ600_5893 [Phytophthora cactorum]|nr:hypothetical protein GQ600_5893 [Phytophthora cactorum]